MRIGVMVKSLNDESLKYSYTLVLPSWGPLYHWQTRELGIQSRIPWKNFFDVPSISRFVNSIDLEDFLGNFYKYFKHHILKPPSFSSTIPIGPNHVKVNWVKKQ